MAKDETHENNPGAQMLQLKRPGAFWWNKREQNYKRLHNNEAGCAFMQHNTRCKTSPPTPRHKNDVFVIFSAPCRCFLAGPLIKNNISIWLVAAGEELWDWQRRRDAGSSSCGNAWQLYSSRLVSSTGVSTESFLGRSSTDRSASVASVICRWHTQTEGEWLAGARGGVCQACRNGKRK